MSRFTHSICKPCWEKRNSSKPIKVLDKEIEKCCFCGKMTKAGIYTRLDPANLLCKGKHS